MMALIKFRVEDGLKHLMGDEEFKRRIVRAYEVQVEQNHGWGFTVRYKGYRIRFDIDDKASTRGCTVYLGYALEEPKTVRARPTFGLNLKNSSAKSLRSASASNTPMSTFTCARLNTG